MNDIIFNIVFPAMLVALAVRTVLAIDTRHYGRACFCFFFALIILWIMAIRWFSGLTVSTVKRNLDIANFLRDPFIINSLFIFLSAGLIWTTFEEYFDAKERRRLARIAKQKEVESLT